VSALVYITTDDCHLCEHGRTVLDELGVERREIRADSEEAAALAAEGIPLSFLPVLSAGARVIAYGRLSARRLRKELDLP
jgi:glutaredoxin